MAVGKAQELMKRYRDERGLSQDDLAHAIRAAEEADGIPGKAGTSYISQIERGINQPSRQRALLIDEILGAHGELAAEFGYRVSNHTNGDAAEDLDLGTLIRELREAVEQAAKRDAQQRELIAAAGDVTDLLRRLVDTVNHHTATLARLEQFVQWREASLGRTESPPASG